MFWSETERVHITLALRRRRAALGDDETHAKEAARLDALIAEREASDAYAVTLKHAGTADDPLAWDNLAAEWKRLQRQIAVRIRKALREQHGSEAEAAAALGVETFKDAVFMTSIEDEEWIKGLSDHHRAIIRASVAGGDDEFKRIIGIGGPPLVRELVVQCVAFQEGTDVGEA